MIIPLLLLSQVFLTLPAFGFNLTILHTNDFHDRVEETDAFSSSCSAEDADDGNCYAGFSRLVSKVKELRSENVNSLLLDAGDQFLGTLWFFEFGSSLTATLMNFAGYDAMGLGNHEFDNGVDGLIPFVDNVSFPVLSSNIDLRNTPELQGKINKSVRLTVGGEIIGVIGYTTVETVNKSNPETVMFTDELAAIQAEADALMADGVNKIIALGHAGFMRDLELARSLRGVDIIVSGDSDTFLYNGAEPSNEVASGPYPTIERNEETDEEVLIVHTSGYGKYLGFLQVEFDDDGNVTSYSGNPILMDSSVEKDTEAESLLDEYRPELEALTTEVIGSTLVPLEGGSDVCRVMECNLGNLVTDAMLRQNIRASDPMHWSDVAIALVNAGGIRASLDKGDITVEECVTVLPYRNTIDVVGLTGSTLLKVFEYSASGWTTNTDDLFGGFLQVSGVKVVYDMNRPTGQKVVDIKVQCAHCAVPMYEPLDEDEVYQVLINSFMADGGDGYSMIPEEVLALRLEIDVRRVPEVCLLEPVHVGRACAVECDGFDQCFIIHNTKHNLLDVAPVVQSVIVTVMAGAGLAEIRRLAAILHVGRYTSSILISQIQGASDMRSPTESQAVVSNSCSEDVVILSDVPPATIVLVSVYTRQIFIFCRPGQTAVGNVVYDEITKVLQLLPNCYAMMSSFIMLSLILA